jgi:outer membrane lipoprotein-sorting protein
MLIAVLAGALSALSVEWSNVRDYTVTIDSREFRDSRSQRQLLKYAYRRPDRARLEIVDGAQRGAIIVWRGNNSATAYRRGLRLFSLHLAPRDERVTSLRGNGVLTPNFDGILACFADHRAQVSERRGPPVEGEPTTAIALARAGFACAIDSPIDREVTRDVLYVSQKSGLPVLRERYVGARLVERWELHDLRLNPNLPDSAFR